MGQETALALMQQGNNVFLTGPPGTGKSFVLRRFIDWACKNGQRVAVTATTGIAASLIGGTTIHAWSGLGLRRSLTHEVLELMQADHYVRERLSRTDCLIIDEISMMSAEWLNMLNHYLKVMRGSSVAFGGMQVILSGDFMQLPPVEYKTYKDFAFTTQTWQDLDMQVCYLTVQYRQTEDELNAILQAIRQRQFSKEHYSLLMARKQEALTKIEATQLLTHNADVEAVNGQYLDCLPGITHVYNAVTSGSQQAIGRLVKTILAPTTLYLKKGSLVMFVANNLSLGYVNGTQGYVIGFKRDMPVVELLKSGVRLIVDVKTWSLNSDNYSKATISQLPLKLAWAVTIHKSQGMGLERAVVDLRHSFGFNMGYVALSRLKSYSGLYLRGINQNALNVDPQLYELDQYLQRQSLLLAHTV